MRMRNAAGKEEVMKKADAEKSARKNGKDFTYPLPDGGSEAERLIQQSAQPQRLMLGCV